MAYPMGEAKPVPLRVDLSSLRSFSSNRPPPEAGISRQQDHLGRRPARPRRHDALCHHLSGVEPAGAGLSTLAERTFSDTGLHPGRVSGAPRVLAEGPDLGCRLTLSINTQ